MPPWFHMGGGGAMSWGALLFRGGTSFPLSISSTLIKLPFLLGAHWEFYPNFLFWCFSSFWTKFSQTSFIIKAKYKYAPQSSYSYYFLVKLLNYFIARVPSTHYWVLNHPFKFLNIFRSVFQILKPPITILQQQFIWAVRYIKHDAWSFNKYCSCQISPVLSFQ